MKNIEPIERLSTEDLMAEEAEMQALDAVLEDEREWSQLSDEEKQSFIESAPGWPGWIF